MQHNAANNTLIDIAVEMKEIDFYARMHIEQKSFKQSQH